MEEKEEKAKWHPIVLEIFHKAKDGIFSFPIFVWSFGLEEKSKRVGELCVLSFEKVILFKAKEKVTFPFSESEKALESLRPYGWEKPPQFDEICRSIEELKTFRDFNEAKDIFRELKQKWEAML